MSKKIFGAKRKYSGRFLSLAAMLIVLAVVGTSYPAEAAGLRINVPVIPLENIRSTIPQSVLTAPKNLYPKDAFYKKLSEYSNYDMDGDGIKEIEKLNLLSFEMKDSTLENDDKLVVILVEPRLLNDIQGSIYSKYDLVERLESFKYDLEAEGYRTRFVEAKVYDGSEHQDGRTVLAMREFFKSIYSTYSNFEGAVLVGSFPEAMLVRQMIWKPKAGKSGHEIDGVKLEKGDEFLRISASVWADRSEIVISDLDGNWDKIYHKEPIGYLKSIEALPDASMGNNWPLNNHIFKCSHVDLYPRDYEDFFFIKENDYWVIDPSSSNYTMMINTTRLNPEISKSDKQQPNPVAKPEIIVSRINAVRIATNPDPDYKDIYGKNFLDEDGSPQTIQALNDIYMSNIWERDPALERRILIDYFDRNHDFRTGSYSDLPFRAAAIAYGSGLSVNHVYNAIKDASIEFEEPVIKENATLLDYVEWLKQPAVLRGIIAHSLESRTVFGTQYNYKDLEKTIGGNPWKWVEDGNTNKYVPSLSNQMERANIYLNRTIWENEVLKGTGANLFVHAGCKVNSPYNAAYEPYNSEKYGKYQNAESIMFFLNGLAVISRAKVFNDVPGEFGKAFGASEKASFGSGWKAYFKDDGMDASLGANMMPKSKRAYCWSVIGDWTLSIKHWK